MNKKPMEPAYSNTMPNMSMTAGYTPPTPTMPQMGMNAMNPYSMSPMGQVSPMQYMPPMPSMHTMPGLMPPNVNTIMVEPEFLEHLMRNMGKRIAVVTVN